MVVSLVEQDSRLKGRFSNLRWGGRLCFNMLSNLLILWVMSIVVLADIQQPDGATEVVNNFQSDLIGVMKQADKLGYQGRYERLAPAVDKSHDLVEIARVALGRYWHKLTKEQKEKFIETFRQLSIATYANKFASYSSEEFRFVSAEDTEKGDRLVRTLLIDAAGGEVHLDYLLRYHDGRWAIINIIANGVSDLALKRSEYSRVLRREGYDALIAKLEEKVARYSGLINE